MPSFFLPRTCCCSEQREAAAFILCSLRLFQLLASDGVQQSNPVSVTITVLDANDNTPAFPNVSYSVNLFTDMTPGETVLQVGPAQPAREQEHTDLDRI